MLVAMGMCGRAWARWRLAIYVGLPAFRGMRERKVQESIFKSYRWFVFDSGAEMSKQHQVITGKGAGTGETVSNITNYSGRPGRASRVAIRVLGSVHHGFGTRCIKDKSKYWGKADLEGFGGTMPVFFLYWTLTESARVVPSTACISVCVCTGNADLSISAARTVLVISTEYRYMYTYLLRSFFMERTRKCRGWARGWGQGLHNYVCMCTYTSTYMYVHHTYVHI